MFFGDYYIKLEHAFFNPDNEIFKSRTALGWTLVHRVLWLFSQWLALVLIFWVLAIIVIACLLGG
ncbi:MAG: hypothetical protein ACJASU_001693 [Cognaticolwellia sp.]|jgi:hypothetical protein